MARSTRLDPDALAATLLRQHNVLTREQAEALSARGLVVLHFSPRQLKNEPDRVVATVRATLAAAAPSRRQPVSVQALPASG